MINLRNQRDNLLSIYRRQGYDYAPLMFSLCEEQIKKFTTTTRSENYREFYNFPSRGIDGPRVKHAPQETFLKYYPSGLKEGTGIDHWGVAYEPGSEAAFHMHYMRHPLQEAQSTDDIEKFEFPQIEDDDMAKQIEQVKELKAAGLVAIGGMECTVWETAWYVRSMEELMCDMLSDDDKATMLLDIVTDVSLKRACAFTRAGVDLLYFGDDIGMQHSIMMSVPLYQKWLKPRLAKIIKAVKEINPDVLIQYHSCGFCEPFIDDLIDVGIDILNPVQPECMDFAEIHQKYGKRLSFNGTLGTQTTMPFGTPDEVREIVKRNLDIAGEAGGLVCCPTHILEPEVPWENIVAYVEACKNYKK